MKAILEFLLPEESAEFECANRASRMASALSEIRLEVRAVLKHEIKTPLEALETIRDIINEALAWEDE